ncbi:MAG: hypothetical protein L0228_08280 [Planctomycetes bacterium]|nr:hypothetical protein [Planctomycetota bacterium]
MRNGDAENAEDLGHEPIAISARTVSKGFGVLFGVVFVSLLMIAGLMLLLAKVDGGMPTVNAPDIPTATPPGVPLLDSDQSGSLRALRARESKVLTEYAWLDSEAGIARIPIKRAMEILGESVNPAPAPLNDDRAN